MPDVLKKLDAVLQQRKQQADPKESYVASLHNQGLNKILEKIGEEATETIIAAKDAERSGSKQELIKETADLWFHSLILLSHLEENYTSVLTELENRFNLSGLKEKEQRSKN